MTEDEICETCGCVIGGGCPEDTQEEREAYNRRHKEMKDEVLNEDIRY